MTFSDTAEWEPGSVGAFLDSLPRSASGHSVCLLCLRHKRRASTLQWVQLIVYDAHMGTVCCTTAISVGERVGEWLPERECVALFHRVVSMLPGGQQDGERDKNRGKH